MHWYRFSDAYLPNAEGLGQSHFLTSNDVAVVIFLLSGCGCVPLTTHDCRSE